MAILSLPCQLRLCRDAHFSLSSYCSGICGFGIPISLLVRGEVGDWEVQTRMRLERVDINSLRVQTRFGLIKESSMGKREAFPKIHLGKWVAFSLILLACCRMPGAWLF